MSTATTGILGFMIMLPKPSNQTVNLTVLYLHFGYRIVIAGLAGLTIYLGYKLFIMGVTGEASIVVNATTWGGQLINASPGLFFAVGGIIILSILAFKDMNVNVH